MTINLNAVRSALVSVFLWVFIAVAGYIIGLGDIWKVDWKVMANIGALSLLTGLVSLVKEYFIKNDKIFGMQVR